MKKIICFDLDGTICRTNKKNYFKAKPKKAAIETINFLYENEFIIKIYTSRFMGRCNENSQKAKAMGFDLTKKQLNSWGLKYDKLILGKPSYDNIIDDKSINFSQANFINFLRKNIDES